MFYISATKNYQLTSYLIFSFVESIEWGALNTPAHFIQGQSYIDPDQKDSAYLGPYLITVPFFFCILSSSSGFISLQSINMFKFLLSSSRIPQDNINITTWYSVKSYFFEDRFSIINKDNNLLVSNPIVDGIMNLKVLLGTFNTYIANYLLVVMYNNFDLEFLDEKPCLSYSDKNLIDPMDQTA